MKKLIIFLVIYALLGGIIWIQWKNNELMKNKVQSFLKDPSKFIEKNIGATPTYVRELDEKDFRDLINHNKNKFIPNNEWKPTGEIYAFYFFKKGKNGATLHIVCVDEKIGKMIEATYRYYNTAVTVFVPYLG